MPKNGGDAAASVSSQQQNLDWDNLDSCLLFDDSDTESEDSQELEAAAAAASTALVDAAEAQRVEADLIARAKSKPIPIPKSPHGRTIDRSDRPFGPRISPLPPGPPHDDEGMIFHMSFREDKMHSSSKGKSNIKKKKRKKKKWYL